jgi:3'-5' exoribonuclease
MANTFDILVKSCEIRSSKNGDYATLKFSKEGGETFDGKIWKQNLSIIPEVKCVYSVYATESIFEGKTQYIIEKYSKRSSFDPKKFRSLATINQEVAFDNLFNYSEKDPDLKEFLSKIKSHLEADSGYLKEKFISVPAGAKNHHSVRAGLLIHILEMIQLAEALIKNGPTYLFAKVDFSLVRVAIILHDMGKIAEYDQETLESGETLEGALLGHVSLGALLVERYWPLKGNREKKLRLQHCLLSHHGQLPWGSPVVPRTPEAILLHSIDMLSAKLNVMYMAEKNQSTDNSMTIGAKPVTDFYPPRTDLHDSK